MTSAAWAATPASGAADAQEGLTPNAPLLVDTTVLGVPVQITNSMVVMWGTMVVLIIFAQVATRKMKDVPDGAQNFWELLVESLYNFLEKIIGPQLVKRTFWFFASLFIFILALNLFSLIPGVGTIGWGTPDPYSGAFKHISRPILRGANADLNTTFSLAMLFFFFWTVWALQANGPAGFILHLFGPKGKVEGVFLKGFLIIIFLCVGLLEVISIIFRPVSLSLRLFGNIYGGEQLLETMTELGGPWLGWLLPVPFYFLELLVAFVQAFVFMLLAAVFTLLIMPEEEGQH